MKHLLVLLLCTFIAPVCLQAQIGTLDVKGSRTKFFGPILGFKTSVQTPIDGASGSLAGKRQHEPITIYRISDGSSAAFAQAAQTNEVIQQLNIALTKPGDKKPYLLIQLTNAVISKVAYRAGLGNDHENQTDTGLLEEINFTYQKISFNWPDSKTGFNDDWLVN